jgi:PhzF family phenazine biosynthesis protein
MKIDFYQADAFTRGAFGGNPAAICMLESWPEDELLQNIAAENNLSETAFLAPLTKGRYKLRWFTPSVEVDLCGHATLASAYVILFFIDSALSSVEFDTLSGPLTVTRTGGLLSMDFPARAPFRAEPPQSLSQALGASPDEVWRSRDLMAVFNDESVVRRMNPDFEMLKQITDALGVIVTAPGKECDFVSRFFAPNAGVPEDPVTGSAHCTLIPYWSQRLGRNRLHALQVSKRGGELFCEDSGDRVTISGYAALYAKGEIYVEAPGQVLPRGAL